MKIISHIVNLVLVFSSIPLMTMQEQIVDVRIQLASDTHVVWNEVPMPDLLKCAYLGTKSSPKEKYIPVISALYEDQLGNDCVRLQKDLCETVPYSITNDLVNKCLFPRHISQSFIDRVKDGNATHVIYENGDKKITARYAIEWLQDKKMAEPSVLPKKVNKSCREYEIPSPFNNGDNFMSIAAVCAILLFIAV